MPVNEVVVGDQRIPILATESEAERFKEPTAGPGQPPLADKSLQKDDGVLDQPTGQVQPASHADTESEQQRRHEEEQLQEQLRAKREQQVKDLKHQIEKPQPS